MSLYIRDSGVWKKTQQGDVFNRVAGAYRAARQIWVKRGGVWFPVWGYAPSPTRYLRWGTANFSDTDFLGGKEFPNQAGVAYTVWSGPQDFISSVCTNVHTTRESDVLVEMNCSFPNYGYVAHPLEFGIATFHDNNSGFPGGWDGIYWPDGSMTEKTGPMLVVYDDGGGPSYWLVYRTDYSGIGSMSWTVDFALV